MGDRWERVQRVAASIRRPGGQVMRALHKSGNLEIGEGFRWGGHRGVGVEKTAGEGSRRVTEARTGDQKEEGSLEARRIDSEV